MDSTSFEPKTIEESFKKNFAEYIDVFLNFQSTFLSNLNTRYKNLDNAHLVLFFLVNILFLINSKTFLLAVSLGSPVLSAI